MEEKEEEKEFRERRRHRSTRGIGRNSKKEFSCPFAHVLSGIHSWHSVMTNFRWWRRRLSIVQHTMLCGPDDEQLTTTPSRKGEEWETSGELLNEN